ncbi:helix-turn-helix domain-containing protein [Roseateles asaccharophilus]|uniref:AraC family transcriptional activator of pobA n=1 Tax=Roseateles asaccharophilus TaxID=582607 RepID=A0ABU2A4L9_9BURK|nr:helix-turn-helix domain-containing protein [Roseateles asaccharophilus]MDR7332149.1 AraC family transcriptional activator of pobA [Roseateles asaccharophilus]
MKDKPERARPPLYELYGELGKDAALDGLHVESISDRSRLHNWEIDLHRHGGLMQLLLIERGRAIVRIDSDELTLPAPALVWVPPLTVHGFRFLPDTAGHVVTLERDWLHELLSPRGGGWAELEHPRALQLARRGQAFKALQPLVAGLGLEYRGTQRWRAQALEGAMLQLASWVARQPALAQAPVASGADGRSAQHLARYREQVEKHFRSQPELGVLVEPLGITPAQMNRICRAQLRCSALDLLHQRLLLEAKRELGYTTLQVRQISDALGFSDPAYFTRFFRRLAGRSPREWREGRV